MTIYDKLFPLGIGTNRFAIKSVEDIDGIERSAELIALALNAGVSYVDVSHSYSKGMAEAICKMAFQQTKARRDVTIKSSFLTDINSDDALRRVESSFSNMGIDHASYFMIWNISSYEQFVKIMSKGSLYEGAKTAKVRGLVDHICFSTHAPADEIIRILQSDAFEGVTISYSVLNSGIMQPVLDYAAEKDIGVVVMNPLGGGIVPQNQDYFSFLRNEREKSTVQSALKYVHANSAVKIVLSGMSSQEELAENIAAFEDNGSETDAERLARVDKHLVSIKGFCTGCRYCEGCPQGIKVFEIMQAYNSLLLPTPKRMYNCTNSIVLENISISQILKNTFAFTPESSENPCAKCGLCEKKCTARLPIMDRIQEMYNRFEESGFAREAMRYRLQKLIGSKRKIAFYPGAGYTAFVLGILFEAFPDDEFEIFLFDSNPKVWGTFVSGIEVLNPDRIEDIVPQIIIISNYNFSEEIYNSIKHYEADGIKVVKLHTPFDVPWVF